MTLHNTNSIIRPPPLPLAHPQQLRLTAPCPETAGYLLNLLAASILQAEVHPFILAQHTAHGASSDTSSAAAAAAAAPNFHCTSAAVSSMLQPASATHCCCGGLAWIAAGSFNTSTDLTDGVLEASDELWLPHRAVSRSASCSACKANASAGVGVSEHPVMNMQADASCQPGQQQQHTTIGSNPVQLWRLRVSGEIKGSGDVRSRTVHSTPHTHNA